MAILITLHPITHNNQKYIIPDNAIIGDNVGAVNYLWSHPYFAKQKWGISLTESSYTFDIVGGNEDGTFAINSTSGELTVADTANLSGDKSITVRVKVYDWYFMDTICKIKVIPEADCVFFDSSYGGGDSEGTRAKPFLKLNNYGSSTGTAGKTYFYKRGETYSNDRNEFTNPKVGGYYPDYIRMGAWGQGARPKINMTGSTGHFVTIGTIPWGNDPIVASDVCNNFEVYDFETYNDNCEDVGHFLVKPAGDNIEFHRIKSENTKYQDGLIYMPTSDAIAGNEAARNIRCVDIETNQAKYRGFKIESEGVTVHNNKGYTDNTLNSLDGVTGTEIPCAQAAHRPHVEIKYMVCICDDISPNNLGLQVRAGYQTYQWCYLEGLAFANVVYNITANDGVGGDYNITSTSGFSDIIIKGALQAGYFGRKSGTTDNPNGVRFERIKLIECEGGFQVAYGAINTLFSYVDASSTKGWGIKVFDHAGSGTRIENGSAMNTFSGSGGLNLDPSAAVVVKNTNYSGLSGSMGAGSTNNSTSSDIYVLNGAGTDLGYSRDIEGNKVPATPSIGAVEASAIIEKPGGWAGVYDSGKGVQGGAGGEMVECKTWTELWTHIDADEDNGDNSPKVYVYTGPDIVLSSPDVYTINEWHNKTVLALFGQSISGAEIRCVDSTNFIWRNWGRKGPFYPWGTGSGEAELDHFTVNSCEGGWFDYCDMDVNFSYNTTDSQYADGMIDTNLSNYITVSNTRFRNGQRAMLIGYSDTQIANRGLLKISLIYCSFENNAARQPKARFGQIHILNCLYKWNPSYATAVTKPSSSNMLDLDAEAQVYVEGTWFENGGELRRDNDGNSPTESGLKLVNCHIEGFVSSNIGEIRPEKVTWVPSSVANYRYPIPVMTPAAAKTHVEDNAGANWHLQSEPEPDTYTVTLSESPSGFGSTSENSSGPYLEGATVEVEAIPATGKRFVRWEEGGSEVSTDATYSFTMGASNRTLVAIFETIPTYTNTITVSPSGYGTASESPVGPHLNSTEVTITATPASGKRFVRWAVEGDLFSTENPHTYFVAGYGYDLVAEFEDIPTYTVALSESPSGFGSTSENSSGPYLEGATVEVEATPATGKRFVRWEEGGTEVSTDATYSFTMGTSNRTLVAIFETIPTYTNTITVSPSGYGTASESPVGPHLNSTEVTIMATPASGKRFVRWAVEGDLFSTENPHSYFVAGYGYDLVAEFEDIPTYTVALSESPSGFGSTSENSSGPYLEGATVEVEATPATGKRFVRWEEGGSEVSTNEIYSFTMGASNRTLVAIFETIPHTLTLSPIPALAGTLTGDGDYSPGTEVTLEASSNENWEFIYWMHNNEVISTNPSFTFIMPDLDSEVIAFFEAKAPVVERQDFEVTVSVTPDSSGTVTGAGYYTEQNNATVVASPAAGKNFLCWKINDVVVSYDDTYTFQMPSNNVLLVAHFENTDATPAEEMDMVRDFVQVSLSPDISEEGIIDMQGDVEFEHVYGSDSFTKIAEYQNPYLYDIEKVNFYVDRAILGKMSWHRPNLHLGLTTEICEGIIQRYRLRTTLFVDGEQDGGESLTSVRHAWMAGRPYDFPDVNICEGKAYLWLTTRPMERAIFPMERSIFYILPLETGSYILQSTFYYKNTIVEYISRDLGPQSRYRPFSFEYFLPNDWQEMDKIEIKIAGRNLKAEIITLFPKKDPEFTLQAFYGNSLGGFDSFCFYGKKENYSAPSSELFEAVHQPNHDRSEGNICSFNHTAYDSFILRTGFITIHEKFALRDMLLRNQVYIVADGVLKKLVIENSEYFTGKDGVYLQSAEIKARLAFNTQSQYGRDPRK